MTLKEVDYQKSKSFINVAVLNNFLPETQVLFKDELLENVCLLETISEALIIAEHWGAI